MGLFGADHKWGAPNTPPPSLKTVTHGETWLSYALSKKDPKSIRITWNTDIDCILINNF